jgi:hypothetical protein
MEIRYTYFWRWGDKSTILYDLRRPGSRDDLRRVISEIKAGKDKKEIVEHTFEIVQQIPMDKVLEKCDEAEKV